LQQDRRTADNFDINGSDQPERLKFSDAHVAAAHQCHQRTENGTDEDGEETHKQCHSKTL